MYRDSAADVLVVLANPGIVPQKGDYTHLDDFVRLSST